MNDLIARAMAMPGAKVAVNFHGLTPEAAREVTRTLGGIWQKDASHGTYWLSQDVGDHQVTVFIKSMCERVQVGTEILPAKPATEAIEVPKYEYRCKELHEAIV